MRKSGFVIIASLVASVSTLVLSARGGSPVAAWLTAPARVAEGGEAVDQDQAAGITFRVSEGDVDARLPVRTEPVETTPLSEPETKALLDRLPPLAAPAGDQQPFAVRESSLPPPRPGKTVAGVFPPETSVEPPAGVSREPLEVVRHAPEGEVPLAPHVSVTFSQPMVAVTSHAELARMAVPVRLTPQPQGEWRWIGARTLVFESDPRLPMATDFTVEVPAGTAAEGGGTLAKPARWTFSTPPPSVVGSRPTGGPTELTPVLFAEFDQKVDPEAVLRTIRLQAGPSALRLRLATAEELEADADVSRLSQRAMPGRWLAFRAIDRLPPNARVTVTVGPGTPSAEGPKVTTKPQTWDFRTFGPLRLTGPRCGWDNNCRPTMPWRIEFSNPIDADAFLEDMVRVDPPLAGMKISTGGDAITIEGRSRARTSYRVIVSSRLSDVFGQALGTDQTATVTVGAAEPWLASEGQPFVVLDPAGDRRFSVYSIGIPSLNIRMWSVRPEDWPAFHRAMDESWRDDRVPTYPGRLVHEASVPVKGSTDEVTETGIDLGPALTGGLGHVVLTVEPPKAQARQRFRRIAVWIQATRIGLDAFADSDTLLAWASALDSGRPLSGVQLSLIGGEAAAVTGNDGVARLPLGDKPGSILVARSGSDVAMLPEYANWYREGAGWRRSPLTDSLRWYVFDDRQLYRPGEEVKLKGWIRLIAGGKTGDVSPLGAAARQVTYKVRDSRGNDVGSGKASLNTLGGFDTSIKLPPTMNLGHASVEFESDAASIEGRAHSHAFQVQEFRRPEFEVTTHASEGPHIVGTPATVSVDAAYYAGGGLPGAPVTWQITSSPGSFTPPNRGDYAFGIWVPWWDPTREDEKVWPAERFDGTTDSSGTHRIRLDFERVTPPRPVNIRAEATVEDVNRQAWTAASNLLVHPSTVAVGLKSDRYFVQQGEPLSVDVIVVDLDGLAVPGRPVRVTAERMDWTSQRGRWTEVALEPQTCEVTSASDSSRCVFRTPEGGTYRITALVADIDGRPHQTQVRRWVGGGGVPTSRGVEQERVTLVPNKQTYRAGEVAEVLVIPPFTPAEALITLRRSGIVRSERVLIASASHTLRIPIDGAWTPNVHLQVDLVGSSPRTSDQGVADPGLPARPAFAMGSLNLDVPPLDRTLALSVAPRARALEPGGETVLDLTLLDAGGRPVAGGEAAVVVVDEAILSLAGYQLPDPLEVFYRKRVDGVSDHHLRASVVLGRLDPAIAAGSGAVEERMLMAAPPPMAAMARESLEPSASPIAVRADFNALALFAASVPTDASGRAEVRVKVPDNLTRYRVMAVAVAGGTQFGSGESTLTARLPLMVRASAPRFLNLGDRLELPVVLQNQTDAPMSVDVAMRATNAVLTAGAGRRVSVAANDRVEVRFPVSAGMPGTARFQVGASSGPWADASEFSLPVWTPATSEAFATYGQIDEGVLAQRVKAPPGAFAEFGGLEVTASSTAVQALTDAVLYLVSYPFDSAETLSSRVLSVAALKDVLAAFGSAGLPDPAVLRTRVNDDLARLAGLQNSDGGFAMWRRGDEAWPYLTIHAAHAMQRARAGGFTVRAEAIERAHEYLKGIEKRIPDWYSAETKQTLVAYALYVRNLMGDPDAGRARRLIQEAGLRKLSFEAVGWLLAVLSGDRASATDVTAIRTYLGNQVTETASTAHFAVSYGDGAHLLFESNRRADAVVLDALITDQPKSDVIPKIVEGLMAHRTAGRWDNTQENTFILLALGRYFDTYEKVTPDFVARVWLGNRYAGERVFKGRTTDRYAVSVPMKMFAGFGEEDLLLSKEGPGRLYYRIGLRYAPVDLELAPLDRGFTVERRYEAIDDPNDVRRDANGTWHIRSGARVRTRLSMVAPARRYHVALVDPLPAGLETLNPALKTTGALPEADQTDVAGIGAPGLGGPGRPGRWWFWIRPWFDHQNLRDERVEAFAALLWEGVYTYSYLSRATTPGTFVVPPPRAEEMYHPDTFGRGATDRVVVEMPPASTSSSPSPARGSNPR